MRLGPTLAVALAPLAIGVGVVAACGGPTFTGAAADGGLPPGAGAGSADAGADGGVSFCAVEAGVHTFCDDFDGPPLASKWSSISQTGGGVAAIDSTRSDSAPSSLKTVAPAGLGATGGRVIETFGTATKVVVAFEVWIDSAPPKPLVTTNGGDNFIEIDVGPSYLIGLSAHDEVAYFENLANDAGVAQNLTSGQLVPTTTLEGAWSEVIVDVDLANAILSVTIGGQQQLNGQRITPPTGQAISVALGAGLHNETASLAVHYDNVTIDITP